MGRNNYVATNQHMTLETATKLVKSTTTAVDIVSDEHRRWGAMIAALCRRTVTVARDDGSFDTYEKSNVEALNAEYVIIYFGAFDTDY